MFNLKDIEPYYGQNMEIAGEIYTLEKVKELGDVYAVWMTDTYLIFATPLSNGVPVHIIDFNDQELGEARCYSEIHDFEHYREIVRQLAETILRRARM